METWQTRGGSTELHVGKRYMLVNKASEQEVWKEGLIWNETRRDCREWNRRLLNALRLKFHFSIDLLLTASTGPSLSTPRWLIQSPLISQVMYPEIFTNTYSQAHDVDVCITRSHAKTNRFCSKCNYIGNWAFTVLNKNEIRPLLWLFADRLCLCMRGDSVCLTTPGCAGGGTVECTVQICVFV